MAGASIDESCEMRDERDVRIGIGGNTGLFAPEVSGSHYCIDFASCVTASVLVVSRSNWLPCYENGVDVIHLIQ